MTKVLKNFHFSFWDPSLTTDGELSQFVRCFISNYLLSYATNSNIHDDDDEKEDLLYDDEVTRMMEIRLGKF